MSKISSLRTKLEQQKGKRDQIAQEIEQSREALTNSKRELRYHEQAREVIREVGLKTQQQLQFHISEIATLAMDAVFSDPYELKVEFVERRNKTECDLLFERGGKQVDPLSSTGGGAVDVAAFALRAASWSMQRPRTRPLFILDEPFKHLKGAEENRRVLDMIKEISDKMGVQILMVSDERIPLEDIVERADKVFQVSIRNRVSRVKEIG